MIYSASRWRNLTPSPLTPAMRAVMEARKNRREQEEQDDNFEKSIKPLPENSKMQNSGNSNGNGSSSSKKRASPPLRASSSSPMKATSTPRRKLNFGNKGKSKTCFAKLPPTG